VKRRAFIGSALTSAAAAALPARQILAAADQQFFLQGATKIVTDVNAVTLNNGTTVIERAVLDELQKSLRGNILLPNTDGYDDARKVWNGMIDKRPALIVQCRGPADVMNAVHLARDYKLLTAVRGGGHNVAGKGVCEGGIVIDCSNMTSVSVDPFAKTARVEPGVLLGAVDHESQLFGLGTPAGVVSHTGAAGLTLGGGFGRLSRIYGLTCDNVNHFDLITASGEFKRVSAEQNPDLFWGLRGGGGNFGIVTSFEYQLYDVGTEFLHGTHMYPIAQTREVLTFFAEFQSAAPRELQVSSNVIMLPGGKGFVQIGVFYIGDAVKGEKLLEPLRKFGKPLNEDIGMSKYVDIQRRTDLNTPHGRRYYQKAGFFNEVQPGLIDAMVEIAADPKPFQTTMIFSQVGGAISDVPNDATAYANRKAQQQMVFSGAWPKPLEEEQEYIAWIRKNWETIVPFTDGVYTNNMMGDEGQKKVISNYGANYDRLIALKNEYDPTNLFRLNVNVPPTV
jgi:hypothetical protein